MDRNFDCYYVTERLMIITIRKLRVFDQSFYFLLSKFDETSDKIFDKTNRVPILSTVARHCIHILIV